MPTLRSVLELTSGLYRDMQDGTSYLREDLLAHLPQDVLETPVEISRVSPGVYTIRLQRPLNGTYELLSRRRAPRFPQP